MTFVYEHQIVIIQLYSESINKIRCNNALDFNSNVVRQIIM